MIKFQYLLLFLLPLVIVSLLFGPNRVEAKEVYINDVIYVPLRSGPSLQNKILHKGLKSGSRLELLEVNAETRYSLVRTQEGLEGWMLSRYLIEEPIALNKLVTVSAQLKQEQQKHQQTVSTLEELKQLHSALQEENVELERIKSLSVDVIAVDNENTRVADENNRLVTQVERLESSNQDLKNRNMQRWFLAGGATVFLGMLFGFLFCRRIYSKQHQSGWT